MRAVGYGSSEGNGCKRLHSVRESCRAGAHGKRNVPPSVSSGPLRMRFFSGRASLSWSAAPKALPAGLRDALPNP